MINITNLTLRYGENTVINDFSLHIAKGEKIALMGPSGCGKTTLLHCIAGLLKPNGGSIALSAQRVSYVFQEPRLLPWLTAAQNVNAVLSDSGKTMDEACAWLQRAELCDDSAKYPSELSGGMQQRISICRALAYDGDILLLDEPLKGLNSSLREKMVELILSETKGKTVLLVTHDEWEAQHLSDKVMHFKNGKFI